MDDLHRALLRWAGRDARLISLRGLVRFGHTLTEAERREVERALALGALRERGSAPLSVREEGHP